jgi:hypothetical protein
MKSPAREAQPLTDEQIDALMPEPCDSLAQDDGFNVIGEQDVWDRAQVRSIVRAALSTRPAPVAPTEPVWPEPAAHRVMAFGRTQHLVVRADVAAEIAEKQQSNAREAGLDSKACVEELFTANQVRAMLAHPAPSAAPAQPTEPVLGYGPLWPHGDRSRGDLPPDDDGSAPPAAQPVVPAIPADVLKAAQEFVANGYLGPLAWAKKVFDWVAAAPSAAIVDAKKPLGDAFGPGDPVASLPTPPIAAADVRSGECES